MTTTIFIGSFNRFETMDRTIAAYERLTTPHRLVIVDNGSDHPACVTYLKQLLAAKRVARVYWFGKVDSMEAASEHFEIAMADQYANGNPDGWYAVSEADIAFEGAHPRTLDAYIALAKANPGYSVGPHLRADTSIPAGYPLRTRVLACETWMQYAADHDWFKPRGLPRMPYVRCQIDTTFHLFPSRPTFDRLRMDPLRVGAPYDAMHLDWHIDIDQPTRETDILIPDRSPLGSWGKAWLRGFWMAYHDVSPEFAFAMLMREPTRDDDLCNTAFVRSWALQYGVGCEPDRETSEHWLAEAIPLRWDRYWRIMPDTMRAVYDNDFSAQGWKKRKVVA